MDTRDSRAPGDGREAQGGITVRRALELPGLRGGLPEVLAGADRLHRTVRWVHAGEVPNIASLLKGGELLLTTGYGLGTRPADQRAFVRTLAERGISALVVELGPRFARLPAALVETARSAGLPLVQLHREVAFVTVTEEIHTEIVNGHYALLQQAEEVHRRCTEALLGGGGIPQVLDILADFSGNPVFLETADGQLLYAAGAGPADTDPLQVWEGVRDRHQDAPPAGTTLVDVYRAEALRRELARLAAEHDGLTGLPLRRLTAALRLTRITDPVASFDCDTWDDIAAARARIREHGHVLDEWISAVKDELGIDLDVDITELLDLARDAAHSVARPAAPLTTFLIGYAAARAGGGPEAVTEAARKASALALRWAEEDSPGAGPDAG
nr:PucR family transcriptional regulator ligand-binding domain-containing protein [Streptomyces scabiei]